MYRKISGQAFFRAFAPVILTLSGLPGMAATTPATTWPEPGVVPAPDRPGISRSAVIFSTRWERTEAPTLARDFHASQIAWLYPRTRDYLVKLQSAGFTIGTTLNANQNVPDEGLARDIENRPLVAPWMQGWGARWISVSSPATRQALFDAATRHIAWGATSIQFDDPALATASFAWGGDFSPAAREGFGKWLAGPGAMHFPDLPAQSRSGHFDYRDWLREQGIVRTEDYLGRRSRLAFNPAWERFHLDEVRSFFGDLHERLHALRPPVALTLNLTNPRPDTRTFNLIDLADGVMSETSADDPANAALGAATVHGLGKSYAPSLQPRDIAATRRQIAVFYALGANPLVPWDIYMPDIIGPDRQRKAQSRYFGTPADYADLYAFVRERPELFDDREPLAPVLLLCQVEYFQATETLALIRELQANQIPFGMMVARKTYPPQPLDAARIARASAVIFASRIDLDDAASRKALSEAASRQLRREDIASASIRLAPVRLHDKGNLLALPRIDPLRPEELILHLVRTDPEPQNVPLAVELNPGFVPYRRIASIDAFSPAHTAPRSIPANGLSFQITMDDEWMTLRIRFETGL